MTNSHILHLSPTEIGCKRKYLYKVAVQCVNKLYCTWRVTHDRYLWDKLWRQEYIIRISSICSVYHIEIEEIIMKISSHVKIKIISASLSVKPFCFWIREHDVFHTHLRNRKHFPCFPTVLETRVEVWENEKLKWEHEPVGRVFQRNSKFSETFTSVSITVCKHGKKGFLFLL